MFNQQNASIRCLVAVGSAGHTTHYSEYVVVYSVDVDYRAVGGRYV